MTCREWEIWISAYHDDALDAERRRRVEQHLAACARCREESEATALLGQALRAAMTRSEAPETLLARVMTHLPQAAPSAPRRRPALRPPRGWLSFGLAPVGIALWLLISGPHASPPAGPITLVKAPAHSGDAARPAASKPAPHRPGGSGKKPSPSAPGEGKASPGKPAPPTAPEARPELEPLRRLMHQRPPRGRDTYARNDRKGRGGEGTRGRADQFMVSRPTFRSGGSVRRRAKRVARTPAGSRQIARRAPITSQPPRPKAAEGGSSATWLSVVDYVLPQAMPERTPAEGPEFVLRAAETYQVTRTSYGY